MKLQIFNKTIIILLTTAETLLWEAFYYTMTDDINFFVMHALYVTWLEAVSEWVVSERHINAIRLYSAIHVGTRWKYRTEDKSKTDTLQKIIQHRKSKQRKIQQTKLPGSVASYDTRPGNEVDLFYNAPEHTWGNSEATSHIIYSWAHVFDSQRNCHDVPESLCTENDTSLEQNWTKDLNKNIFRETGQQPLIRDLTDKPTT